MSDQRHNLPRVVGPLHGRGSIRMVPTQVLRRSTGRQLATESNHSKKAYRDQKESDQEYNKEMNEENVPSSGQVHPRTVRYNERGRTNQTSSYQEKLQETTSNQSRRVKESGTIPFNRGIQAKQSKTKTLFVKFGETIQEHIDIFSYLLQRLPNGMKFTYLEQTTDEVTGNTIVVLQCPSRYDAEHLEEELEKSNDECDTKICCFNSFEEAHGLPMSTKEKNHIFLEKCTKDIMTRTELSLAAHEAKIEELTEKIMRLQQSKPKFLSLEDFAIIDQEQKAIEDKLKELQRQKVEFQNFIASVHLKFIEIQDSPTCQKPAIEIMKAFGVECNRLDKALPMYARRSDILDIVKNNQVSVIIGETGSGKSTQMAQYLYQSGHANNGMIACTQPRKIAAISVATHVASEMGTSVGDIIGYKVGMQEKKTSFTKVLFMTDHALLKECLRDRNLSSFSCIIIDEAHERSIYTDLLLGMIKSCLDVRTDLRVVVTSATIDPEVFVQYFGKCPVLSVSGRMFPVEVIWREPDSDQESFSNYIDECVKKAMDVHYNQPEGDILVFVTSPQETEICCEKFMNFTEERDGNFVCLQLHGKLQAEEQRKVFDTIIGKRKIVFATNSAETSVTIPGIRYVIDTGLAKEMSYDPKRKMNTLAVTTVAQSSANQRKGRAGRLGPGVCFRLYTEDEYDTMKANMVPEILRVNLGQAMLKLMELDIDPLEFDFVMSPSKENMESAVSELENLGAVSARRITDLGKWISKLPFDPKFGVFIHNTLSIGTGLEGIVISAACSGGPVFFRAGTTDEKEQADRKKMKFCHENGDLMTMLNVFREWSRQPEKARGPWCFDQSINGKAMKGIKEVAKEVLLTLKRELQTEVQFRFDDPDNVDHKLIKPLLKIFRGNISHYLGHPKAGYVLVTKDQRVEVHPSSSLISLGNQPEWLVFDQVMKTSRDFAMNITPVSKEMVLDGIEEGLLDLDIKEARRKRVIPIVTSYVGSKVFREVVGPRYATLRTFEEALVEKCLGSIVVVEADREIGELKIFSQIANQETLEGSLDNVLKPIKDNFLCEEREEKLGVKSTDRSVRAILRAGGCTKSLLMPDEYKVVMIHCAINKTQELEYDDVFQHFSKFGTIAKCSKYHFKKNAPSLWGQVVYQKTEDAVRAVSDTRGNPDLSARPSIRLISEQSDKFKVRIQWCRRRSRGFGFITFSSMLDADNAIRKGHILVGNSVAKVKPSKTKAANLTTEGQIHVAGLSQMVNEDVLRESFAKSLDLDPVTSITRVTVIREKVSSESEDILNIIKRRLRAEIENYVDQNSYALELRPIQRETEINFTAFVTFDKPEDGQIVCEKMDHKFVLNDQTVSAKAVLHCSLYIPKRIYEKSSDAVSLCVRELETEGVRMKTKTLRNENVVIEINTDDVETLVRARRSFQDIIKGEVIECDESVELKSLFTWEGRNKLKHIMHQTETFILADNRVMSVSIHGLQQNRQRAKQKIDEFLLEISSDTSEIVILKGEGKPPGVLKALLLKYTSDFSKLCQETGLVSVRLDQRNHRLMLFGSESTVNAAKTLIREVMGSLSPIGVKVEEDDPECITCFCPMERKDLYRIECCGHPYCKECLQLQVQTSITHREFPLKCEMEDCNTLFTWQDITSLSKMGYIKISELTDSSVGKFVQENKKKYRFCITPDCSVVYRITEIGKLFSCPECNIRLCTSCHVQFHDGITCAMFKAEGNEDQTMRSWFSENRANRKRCPNCAMPIEKNGGCNHMTCLSCKKHICWLCLDFFDECGACYGHLGKAHGSFV
ncbi:ATP-dependent RNA helicase DEAH12, chloroplastic-like [Pecten maximus]|uniref:ATP-dependent RNA helicase DEAH12, chloroplastic-like n=1 Tax=Pecten maximus TaxID=6579 RepID=UPI0014588685|nr:ATP-dependent RNA helicase DEAH12, chloroplastic-like [Pecten maximus]XP_033747971.1 ATP-dependent RNA helicase DEAH12, chloroplastic-like [Pecten maximus]XP_033747972.1 ATP-dependent RNA helicase DEAH12, chloroplastic-like [Pecten maximus]XP_033747973.1 ATP-dependent RNA helicase DEAH12, chloroplastic-like [Pecten maximus]XP_033747974.1 ATP-dependent RNA helicase DEAH12, chloroplastic-like [Pecten maximus]XP_033747975.1 ATP-dependent RNA helicase DEAH12, chloroplastic-like [Pecten maximus]